MSDIDLTEAVEALAIRARLADRAAARAMPWAALPEGDRRPWRDQVRWQVEVVALHIERQVREQVAREIEAVSLDGLAMHANTARAVTRYMAGVARGTHS